MASVLVLLETFIRKGAAVLGFFPCATAPSGNYKYVQLYPYTNQVVQESRKSVYKAPGFFVHWSYRGMGSSGCGKTVPQRPERVT